MAAITAAMVKELREMTGAGMMDCKKALGQTDGDMDKAVEFLRENGLAKAAKKAGRIAAEGLVTAVVDGDKNAAIVEVNSETDFVAKNADFAEYVAEVANQALTTEAADIDAFMKEAWKSEPAKTVEEALAGKIAVIGENLKIRRFERVAVDNGCVVSYIHGAGRIGVLVVADTAVVNDDVKEALKNIAMQIAAMNPKYISRADVDQDYIEGEKKVLLAEAKNEKPDANDKMLEGIVNGRINKQLKEICLMDQVYVKAEDGKQSVAAYLADVSKKVGSDVKVVNFVRFETGEGLEKKNEDFAAEVAAQMGM